MKYVIEVTNEGRKITDEWIDRIDEGKEYPEWLDVLLFVRSEYVYTSSKDINIAYKDFKEVYENYTGFTAPSIDAFKKCVYIGWLTFIPMVDRVTVRFDRYTIKRLHLAVREGYALNISDAIRKAIDRWLEEVIG